MPATATPAELDSAYAGITAAVRDLSDEDLQRPTRCHGWVVADLLFHVLCDARRALVALASPADGPPDVDAVSYWAAYSQEWSDAAGRHAWWARRSAAAFDRPRGIVDVWSDTAPATARAATRWGPEDLVTTQGHVLTVADLLGTLVTEAVIHHLDLTVELPGAPPPASAAVAVATATMDGLLDAGPVPDRWTPTGYLLRAAGREPLDADDRAALGTVADRFPLLR
ncbi:maleylpyruvate isomerase N-terminal domain-containing protein [Plantactinospora siamensis]|uniref:Maleylpyruvate isomerase N-terminal domain-containing protein n=1 Tax=Plantactinospora siamensis TaxID=555372 RepID=A0ABV6NQV9_9ACTN